MEVNVRLDGYLLVDFDPKKVRAGVRKSAGLVRKTARRFVSRKAVSEAGDYPGKGTGKLQSSIKVRMARQRGGTSGMWAAVSPTVVQGMKNFYPAILVQGVTGKARRKDHKAQAKSGQWRIAPRKNFIEDALDKEESAINNLLGEVLVNSLVPRRFEYK